MADTQETGVRTMEKTRMDQIWTNLRYRKIMAEEGIEILGLHRTQDICP